MKSILVISIMFLLASCSHVTSKVSRFNRVDSAQGKKVFVAPMNETQGASIEFENYKKIVIQELSKYGVLFPEALDDADWILMMNYGVSGSQTETGSVPLYGQTGGGTTYHSGSINSFSGSSYNYSGTSYSSPTYGVVGAIPYSQKSYNRFLKVVIVEKTKQTRETASNTKPKMLFEGSVRSSGSSAHFEPVSKCLFKAVFKNFPGESSESYSEDSMFPCK